MSLSKPETRLSTRKLFDEALGLHYPIDQLLGARVPKNRQVLLHFLHFHTVVGMTIRDAATTAATSVFQK
jgi:hypothetical protein